ncbi:MAG: beta galactosidase jelly roll domain-containing protein [Treponema sp.]|nr:beta galactosidase jelly roll domain-containing protein [Treponema sp.]
MKCYQNGYPRPQFVRDRQSWENLDGPWDFSFDDKNEGIAKKWFNTFPAGREIIVPFCHESPASGIGDSSRHDVVWYRKTLTLHPRQKQGSRVILHFEGSDYHTKLWVNGSFAGSHDGAYARFSFDITSYVKPGNNTLTVRAEDSPDISQPRGKQRWKNESYGCWYVQTTGIWKTVWLEYVNPSHIASVKMTPFPSRGILDIEAEIESPCEDMELEVQISFKDLMVTKLTADAGAKRLCLSAGVFSTAVCEWGLHTWSPGNPNLYDISFTLKKSGKIIDQVLSYFGMREIRIDGRYILLNGHPLYQRLILDQGYWKDSHLTPPGEQALVTDIDKILSAGYNGVRKHQKVEDERFLYWADVKGLLVWSEMASAYEFNDDAVSMFTREWMEVVKQHYNHPSIITWTPFNESWGISSIKNRADQQAFTQTIYYLTKSYDQYRPVICNDGWEHTVSDIITLHDYEEKGDDFFARYGEHLEEILNNRLYPNLHRACFASSHTYRGQPIIISEYGGIAFDDGQGWGYGNKVTTKEDFIKRFDAITTAIKKVNGLCGFCYTQVTDVQQEINGIMDMDRNFKIDPDILREINERKVNKLV